MTRRNTPTAALIEACGGTVKTAKLAGVSPQAVHRWITNNKIPAGYVVSLCQASRAFRPQDVRPDVFQFATGEL